MKLFGNILTKDSCQFSVLIGLDLLGIECYQIMNHFMDDLILNLFMDSNHDEIFPMLD